MLLKTIPRCFFSVRYTRTLKQVVALHNAQNTFYRDPQSFPSDIKQKREQLLPFCYVVVIIGS